MKRLILILSLLWFGCAEQTTRQLNSARPNQELEELPDYEIVTSDPIPKGQSAVVSIRNSSLVIPGGATTEDIQVQLKLEESLPDVAIAAGLGDPYGDVVTVSVFDPLDRRILSSAIFAKPYTYSIEEVDGADEKNLVFAVVTDPGSDQEALSFVRPNPTETREGISTAFSADLRLTNATIFLIEHDPDDENTIEIVDNGGTLTTDGGETITDDGQVIDDTPLAMLRPEFPVSKVQTIDSAGIPLPSDKNDSYGSDIVTDGTYLAVAAERMGYDKNGENPLNNSGLVFIYKLVDDAWEQIQILDAGVHRAQGLMFGGGNDVFDHSMAMVGDYLIVGTNDEIWQNKKDVYVFKRTGDEFSLHQVIERPFASDEILHSYSSMTSLSAKGAVLVVGYEMTTTDETGGDVNRSGSVYVFELLDGNWTFTQALKGRTHNGQIEQDDYFAFADTDGTSIVVGARNFDGDATGASNVTDGGAAFVFEKQNGTWQQTQLLTPSSRHTWSYCGRTPRIDGDTIALPCEGYNLSPGQGGTDDIVEGVVFVFVKTENGWREDSMLSLHPHVTLAPSTLVRRCGIKIDLRGNDLIMACPDSQHVTYPGFAIFRREGEEWNFQQAQVGDTLGQHIGSVKIFDEMVFIAYPRRKITVVNGNTSIWDENGSFVEIWK